MLPPMTISNTFAFGISGRRNVRNALEKSRADHRLMNSLRDGRKGYVANLGGG